MGEAATSANVSVLMRSNVVTETENETAMQQINYLESKEVRVVHDPWLIVGCNIQWAAIQWL